MVVPLPTSSLVEFGEDKEIDRLIRKYGYFGTPATLKATKENCELKENLGAAAHLIHGSSEGRFSITYCPGKESGNITREKEGDAAEGHPHCQRPIVGLHITAHGFFIGP